MKTGRHFNDPSLLATFVLSAGRKKTEMSGETVMRALEIVYKKNNRGWGEGGGSAEASQGSQLKSGLLRQLLGATSQTPDFPN